MSLICGIDPGFSGGIAFIDSESGVQVYPMPVVVNGKHKFLDAEFVVSLFQSPPTLVVIEEPIAMPKLSCKATASTFRMVGRLEGICDGMGLPRMLVRPQDWYREILVGHPKKDKNDKPSLEYVMNRFRGLSLLPTDKSKKPSDGMSDAVCIALYGQKQIGV